jgi:hypothetical protein
MAKTKTKEASMAKTLDPTAKGRMTDSLWRAYVELGYPDLSREAVSVAVEGFFAGRKPVNVIEVMVTSDLKKVGAKPL